MRLDRQSVFAIVAMLVFAIIMGGIWVATHGFGDEFGMGFAVGMIAGLALASAAIGWRSGASDRKY